MCLLLLGVFVWRAGAQTCPQVLNFVSNFGDVSATCNTGSVHVGDAVFTGNVIGFPAQTQLTIPGTPRMGNVFVYVMAGYFGASMARFTPGGIDVTPPIDSEAYSVDDYVYTCATPCMVEIDVGHNSGNNQFVLSWYYYSSATSPVLVTTSSSTSPVLVTTSSSTSPKLATTSSTTGPGLATTSSTTGLVLLTTSSSTSLVLVTTSSSTSPKLVTTSSSTSPVLVTTSSSTSPKLVTTSSSTSPVLVTTSSSTSPVLVTTSTSLGPLEEAGTTTSAAAADAGSTSQTLTATGDPAETFPVALVAGVGGGVLGFLMLLCCCWACMSRASTPSIPMPTMPRSVQSVQPAPSAPPASSAPPGPLKPMEPVVQPVVVRNGERLFSSMPVMWDTQCPECMMYGMCHACWYKSNYDNIRVERLSRYRV